MKIRVVALCGALLTTGCASSNDATPSTPTTTTTTRPNVTLPPAPPGERLGRAAVAMAALSSYRYTMSVSATATGGRRSIGGEGRSVGGRNSLRIELGGGADGPAMLIVADATATWMNYEHLPPGSLDSLGLPAGWIRVVSPDATAALSSGIVNLASIVRALAHPTTAVTDAGGDTVDGVATSHLRTTLDLSPDLTGVSVRHSRAQAAIDAQRAVLRAVPTELWVDGDDHVRQIRYTMTQPTGSSDTTMQLFDLGSAAAIELPPTATTMTLEQFFTSTMGPDDGAAPAGPSTTAR